jgi:hypothetical protein
LCAQQPAGAGGAVRGTNPAVAAGAAAAQHYGVAVLAGEFSANETQASYDEAVYRALLHFRGEMSDGLRQYVLAQLARSKAEWCPTSRWNHCGARTPRAPRRRQAWARSGNRRCVPTATWRTRGTAGDRTYRSGADVSDPRPTLA